MAEIVAVCALSHAPGLTGWLDRAPPEEQESLTRGFHGLGGMLRETRPDVIVGIANDHLLNLPLDSSADSASAPPRDGPAGGMVLGLAQRPPIRRWRGIRISPRR